MMTIVIAGTFELNAERIVEAHEVMSEMAAASAAEAGCRSYRFSTDLAIPTRCYIFEEWDSDEALTAHFGTEHMARFSERVVGLVAGRPKVTRYEVSSLGPLG